MIIRSFSAAQPCENLTFAAFNATSATPSSNRPLHRTTNENRARYDRSDLRYPSDVTDAEWELISPVDPACKARRRQAQGEHARGRERPHVCSLDRLSVARDPEGFAAQEHGLRLFRSLDL